MEYPLVHHWLRSPPFLGVERDLVLGPSYIDTYVHHYQHQHQGRQLYLKYKYNTFKQTNLITLRKEDLLDLFL